MVIKDIFSRAALILGSALLFALPLQAIAQDDGDIDDETPSTVATQPSDTSNGNLLDDITPEKFQQMMTDAGIDTRNVDKLLKEHNINPNYEQTLRENGIDPNNMDAYLKEKGITKESLNEVLRQSGIDDNFVQGVMDKLGVTPLSGDDEWACRCVLCVANPKGPTAEPECREAIKKLQKHLAQGKSFPTCPGTGSTTTKPKYDPCPEGSRELETGEKLASSNIKGRWGISSLLWEGRNWERDVYDSEDKSQSKNKVCIPADAGRNFCYVDEGENRTPAMCADKMNIQYVEPNAPGTYRTEFRFSNGYTMVHKYNLGGVIK